MCLDRLLVGVERLHAEWLVVRGCDATDVYLERVLWKRACTWGMGACDAGEWFV